MMTKILALAVVHGLAGAAQAQSDWVYQPMNQKGVVCREGGATGLAIRRAPHGSKRFLIVMQGGGGCYDEKSCEENPKSFTQAEFESLRLGQLNMGIFFRSPNNPLTAYHQIYIPYCSGDMHAGERDDYFNQHVQEYRGRANTELYFDEIVAQFATDLAQPDVEVMLLGQSAGGYGAMFTMPRLRAKLRAISPSIKLTLVDESAPPMDAALVTTCFAKAWRDQYDFANTFLKECPSCAASSNWLAAWQEHLLASYPDVPQALIASTQDFVINKFLRDGLKDCSPKPTVTVQTYTQGLATIRTRMQSARVQHGAATATFFITAPISNLVHIFTTLPYYYSHSARNPSGIAVRMQDWLSSLFDRRPTPADDLGPL